MLLINKNELIYISYDFIQNKKLFSTSFHDKLLYIKKRKVSIGFFLMVKNILKKQLIYIGCAVGIITIAYLTACYMFQELKQTENAFSFCLIIILIMYRFLLNRLYELDIDFFRLDYFLGKYKTFLSNNLYGFKNIDFFSVVGYSLLIYSILEYITHKNIKGFILYLILSLILISYEIVLNISLETIIIEYINMISNHENIGLKMELNKGNIKGIRIYGNGYSLIYVSTNNFYKNYKMDKESGYIKGE